MTGRPQAELGRFMLGPYGGLVTRAIHDTGAHGFAMGCQYNGKLRSAEVLLQEDGQTCLIRCAEVSDNCLATVIW